MQFSFDDLVAVMARLRGPDGCPWDREQTHASLAPYLLEEAHEVLDAISGGDPQALQDELGDLLLQVVFHAQMAAESGAFDAGDVTDGLVRKLLDRHPHVFGDLRLGTPAEVLARWHELKRREAPDRGAFEGIPASLPALARAQKLQQRTATSGEGTWPPPAAEAAAGLRQRVERVRERLAAGSPEEVIGDLLWAAVTLAAAAEVDAEGALREACERFAGRRRGP